jgi:hypothetical protein
MNPVKLQLGDGGFHQGHMGPMRRVERAAKNTQTQHGGLSVVRGSK